MSGVLYSNPWDSVFGWSGVYQPPNFQEPKPLTMVYLQMDRLCHLLGLPEEERSFVRAALKPEQDRDFFLVVADWLEEQGRVDASGRYRQMGGSDG